MKEYMDLLKERDAMYRLLSGFYLRELDEEHIERLRDQLQAAGGGQTQMDEGIALIRSCLCAPAVNRVDELASDYARAFLGAGVVDQVVAYPFESVYTSSEKLVCQDAYEEVYKLFRAEGLQREDKDLYDDHIALEFTFMGHLCQKAIKAIDEGDERRFELAIDAQKEFLQKHLLRWVFRFTADVRACPIGDFYKGVSLITDGFIQTEKELFELT